MIHNRKSIRLQGYDYSRAGLYFITLCVQDRVHLFGEIVNAEMNLNDTGIIADKCWKEIPEHFPNAILHEYIIMPNHIHGIIELTNNIAEPITGIGVRVRVEDFQPLPLPPKRRNEFQQMIPRSIGSIVKGFKIGVTKWCRKNTNIQKIWQRNYYEVIIRDHASYGRISDYIINNPKKWENDKFKT